MSAKEKIKELSEDQRNQLALFAYDYLSIGGTNEMIGMLAEIIFYITHNSGENELAMYSSHINALSEQIRILSELNGRIWEEKKTLLGLTGVDVDDIVFGLKGVLSIR